MTTVYENMRKHEVTTVAQHLEDRYKHYFLRYGAGVGMTEYHKAREVLDAHTIAYIAAVTYFDMLPLQERFNTVPQHLSKQLTTGSLTNGNRSSSEGRILTDTSSARGTTSTTSGGGMTK